MKVLLILVFCGYFSVGNAQSFDLFERIANFFENIRTPISVKHNHTLEQHWNEWKIQHNRNYKSFVEEKHRREIFERRLQLVNEHNKLYEEGKVPFKMKMQQYADLTLEEFFSTRTGLLLNSNTNRIILYNNPISPNPAPAIGPENCSGAFCCILYGNCGQDPILREDNSTFSWLTNNSVTPVKNQGNCGSCWAFAVTGSLESQILIKTKLQVVLSEQQLVDCENRQFGCSGGDPYSVFNDLKDKGIALEISYPYRGQQGQCLRNFTRETFIVTGQTENFRLGGREQSLMNLVKNYGPAVVAIYASERFMLYNEGVFVDNACNLAPNHAVLVIGYGIDSKTNRDYWLVKNSWGSNWGENGFIKMARNSNNMCGIANYGTVPNIQIL